MSTWLGLGAQRGCEASGDFWVKNYRYTSGVKVNGAVPFGNGPKLALR